MVKYEELCKNNIFASRYMKSTKNGRWRIHNNNNQPSIHRQLWPSSTIIIIMTSTQSRNYYYIHIIHNFSRREAFAAADPSTFCCTVELQRTRKCCLVMSAWGLVTYGQQNEKNCTTFVFAYLKRPEEYNNHRVKAARRRINAVPRVWVKDLHRSSDRVWWLLIPASDKYCMSERDTS